MLVCCVERIAIKQTFKSWTHLFSLPKYAQLNGCARSSFVRRRPFVVPSRPAINDADCARQSLRADASQNHDRLHALLDEIGPSSRALAARVGRSDVTRSRRAALRHVHVGRAAGRARAAAPLSTTPRRRHRTRQAAQVRYDRLYMNGGYIRYAMNVQKWHQNLIVRRARCAPRVGALDRRRVERAADQRQQELPELSRSANARRRRRFSFASLFVADRQPERAVGPPVQGWALLPGRAPSVGSDCARRAARRRKALQRQLIANTTSRKNVFFFLTVFLCARFVASSAWYAVVGAADRPQTTNATTRAENSGPYGEGSFVRMPPVAPFRRRRRR